MFRLGAGCFCVYSSGPRGSLKEIPLVFRMFPPFCDLDKVLLTEGIVFRRLLKYPFPNVRYLEIRWYDYLLSNCTFYKDRGDRDLGGAC